MKFNMEYPKNGWLEDNPLPFVMLTFQGRTVKLPGCTEIFLF